LIYGRKSLKVFVGVLRWMTTFDGCLEVFEVFNPGHWIVFMSWSQTTLDGPNELEPNNVEQVVVLCFLFDFAHEGGIERGKKKLGGGEIVCFVVIVVEEVLARNERLCDRDGVARVKHSSLSLSSRGQGGKQWRPSHKQSVRWSQTAF
jgi:hypothetical protein